MKKSIAIALVLALTGCGGESVDEWSNTGGTGTNTPNQPNKPSPPTNQKNWQYSSVADGSRVFALSATTYSLNAYQRPDYKNLEGRPWLTLERSKSRDNVVKDTVVIFADSNTSCSPTCDVRMSFDGNWAAYRMRNSIDGVLRPNDDATGTTLYKKFTSSNRATVRLPIIGLSQPFDANFDLSGYDLKWMKF